MDGTQTHPGEIPFPDELKSDTERGHAYDLLRKIADTDHYITHICPKADTTRFKSRFYTAGSARDVNVSIVVEDLPDDQVKLIVTTKGRWGHGE
jgi:hypothetical protein